MRFNFGEDQLLFQTSVRDFLTNECTPEQIRDLWSSPTGRSSERWQQLADMGVLGILVPEAYGGLGMNEIDFVLPLEETGGVALPEPVVESAVVATGLFSDIGGSLAENWLPKLASGEAIATVGHPINPTVADAHIADLLLLERDSELHAVERADAELQEQACSDYSRKLFTVEFAPSETTRIAAGNEARAALDRALDRASLAVSAQLVGIAQKLVTLAVDYSKERQQFGKAIGTFQALKHHLASVQVKVEFARPSVYRAAHSVAHDATTRAVDVSQAKTMAADAAMLAAKTALQIHGAIGYTWEVDLHMWMKRAWALESAWGSRLWHRARIAESVLADKPAPSFGFEGRS
jgi:alkylation response protein AidB-like acyl-CoA dehydrogenase